MKQPITLAALLLAPLAALHAAEPLLEKSEIFPPGLNGVARSRIPGVVVTPKGTVLAYCEARKNDSKDWGEIEIHLRRSTDGGKTWQPSQPGTLIFSGPHTLPPPAKGAQPPKSKAAKGKRENLSIKLSRDDGKTWSINKTLEAGPSAYSDLAVLPDGTVLCLFEHADSITCARFNLEWITAP